MKKYNVSDDKPIENEDTKIKKNQPCADGNKEGTIHEKIYPD